MNIPVLGNSNPRLAISDAVAAIIRTPRSRFLMQLRDTLPNIWYPGSWGCFGGGVDPGEKSTDALRRELREELELELKDATLVSRLEFDLRPVGRQCCFRDYYLVELAEKDLAKLVLHEGERMAEFTFEELAKIPVTPYDAFALHLFGMSEMGVLIKPEASIKYNQHLPITPPRKPI